MKKLSFVIIVFIAFIAVAACSPVSGGNSQSETIGGILGDLGKCTVRFIVDGATVSSNKISIGSVVKKPSSDPKKNNYIFLHWSESSSSDREFDFTKKIYSDTKLYAVFSIDAAKITNQITTKYIQSVFTIKAISSKTVYEKWDILKLFGTKYQAGGQGSGVCFRKSGNKYYLLTNCHVAKQLKDYTSVSYTVEDYQGKTYTAYLYKNSSKSSSAISADYDLACLYFTSNTNYPALSMSSSDPEAGSDVIALGSPKSQSNAITYGNIRYYANARLANTATYLSNVKFKVAYHNAFVNNGSSGGPIINADFNIVGINYGGSEDGSSNCSIPATKVNQFLNEYVY